MLGDRWLEKLGGHRELPRGDKDIGEKHGGLMVVGAKGSGGARRADGGLRVAELVDVDAGGGDPMGVFLVIRGRVLGIHHQQIGVLAMGSGLPIDVTQTDRGALRSPVWAR